MIKIRTVERILDMFLQLSITLVSLLSAAFVLVFILFVTIVVSVVMAANEITLPTTIVNVFIAGLLPFIFILYLVFNYVLHYYYAMVKAVYITHKKKRNERLVSVEENEETYTLIEP